MNDQNNDMLGFEEVMGLNRGEYEEPQQAPMPPYNQTPQYQMPPQNQMYGENMVQRQGMPAAQNNYPQRNYIPVQNMRPTKFCKFCGSVIDAECVVCPACGRQVEELRTAAPAPQNIVIRNENNNNNVNTNIVGMGYRKECNKWTSFFLCLFLGGIGAHKFYEGKTGMGILYLFTLGLFGIGAFIDLISILFKPNPYYV